MRKEAKIHVKEGMVIIEDGEDLDQGKNGKKSGKKKAELWRENGDEVSLKL